MPVHPNLLSEDVIAQISAIAGPVAHADQLANWAPGYHPDIYLAGFAVSPETPETLSALLAYCDQQRIPVITHGGLTGLVGGTASATGSLIISTRRMNKHIAIDPVSHVAIVDAGVTLEALQLAAAEHGLSPGIDLPARGSATLGGMAATNAGGIEAFREGSMRDRILGSVFVRANGEIVDDLAQVLKNNTGYGLTDLIVGSEGTLGIFTQLAIRLTVLRPVAAAALFAFETLEQARIVAQNLCDHFGDRLRAIEILWRDYAETIVAEHGRSLGDTGLGDGKFLLLAETEQTSENDGEARFLAHLETLYEAELIRDAVLAQNDSQRQFFWLMREDADVLFRLWPFVHSFDVSLPLAHLADYTARIEPELRKLATKVGVYIFGHLGDGNLHIMIGLEHDLPHAAIEAILYPGLAEIGGAFSAEHGVGLEKRDAFARFGNSAKLRTMQAIKSALDPNAILNPGKIFL